MAVSKYEEVLASLDLVRELSNQISKLVAEEAKERKKASKREQLEKTRAELAKVSKYFSRGNQEYYVSMLFQQYQHRG